jgi:hypothetical protein
MRQSPPLNRLLSELYAVKTQFAQFIVSHVIALSNFHHLDLVTLREMLKGPLYIVHPVSSLQLTKELDHARSFRGYNI